MMIRIEFLFCLGISALLVSGQYELITEIHTLTGTNPMAEGNGQIGVTIINQDAQFCSVSNLDEDGDTFLRETIDAFYGTQIGSCDQFSCPNKTIPTMQITHSGIDDVQLQWIRVAFNDSTFIYCDLNNYLFSGETSLTINNCGLPLNFDYQP